MFLPVGDTPNPNCRPTLTYALIGINVAIFLLYTLPMMSAEVDIKDPLLAEYLRSRGVNVPLLVSDIKKHLSAYDLAVFRWGFRPADPSPVTLISAMFLHGGWMHLLGNMLYLFIFGDNVECRLGKSAFLLSYLGTGVASTLFFSVFAWGSETPLVGASGAISGILGFYFIWFPRNKVKTFVFLFPFIMTTILLPARLVLGVYLVVMNVIPFLFTVNNGGGGVAYGAHIGGFIAGAAIAWGLNLPRRVKASETVAVDRSTPSAVGPLLDQGQVTEAAELYSLQSAQQRRHISPQDLLRLAQSLQQSGRSTEACSVLRRMIADHPTSELLGHAYLQLGRVLAADGRTRTSAYQYLLHAIDVAKDPEVVQAARRELQALE